MPLLPFLLCKTVSIWLSLAMLAMLLRTIRALFMMSGNASILDMLLISFTEPVIFPARIILGEKAAQLPLDIPFILTWFLLVFLRNALPAVSL